MAKIGETSFNAESIDTSGFQPIPPSRQNFVITDSDYLENGAKTGHYLKLELKVIDGEFVNRKVWVNLNLDNPNETAVSIAQRDLAALCKACGLSSIEDSEELHGIPFSAQVRIKPEQNGYPAANTVSNFKEPVDNSAEDGETPPWA